MEDWHSKETSFIQHWSLAREPFLELRIVEGSCTMNGLDWDQFERYQNKETKQARELRWRHGSLEVDVGVGHLKAWEEKIKHTQRKQEDTTKKIPSSTTTSLKFHFIQKASFLPWAYKRLLMAFQSIWNSPYHGEILGGFTWNVEDLVEGYMEYGGFGGGLHGMWRIWWSWLHDLWMELADLLWIWKHSLVDHL